MYLYLTRGSSPAEKRGEPGRTDHVPRDVLCVVLCVVLIIELLPMLGGKEKEGKCHFS